VPSVTALRELRGGRVAVEVDGAEWRTVPAGVVARAGLLPGTELDRPRLRTLRRELRRHDALAAAGRALRSRDLSVSRLDARLEARGIARDERAAAVATLADAGLVDDERYARARAAALAERDRGDAAIRWQLERDGIATELVERAVAALPSEEERAREIVARRGRGGRTARFLASRGFGESAVEAASADPDLA
jgi:SOS response regulatory protein OraA/RecX